MIRFSLRYYLMPLYELLHHKTHLPMAQKME